MEDELRREYDLKSLRVRRLGAARKSFGGPFDFSGIIERNKIEAFFQPFIEPIASLKYKGLDSKEFHRWKLDVEEKFEQLPNKKYLQKFSNIDFDKNYESALNKAEALPSYAKTICLLVM